MTYPAYIGVDPGSPLSLAIVDTGGKLLATAGDDTVAVKAAVGWLNSPELIASVIKKWCKWRTAPLIVIENVGPMPNEGLLSACKFAGSIWLVKGVASALGIKYVMVTPQVWKKSFGLKGGPEFKDMSRMKALTLWPDKAQRFRLKKSHNIAEAALLAEWARVTKAGE